MVKMLSNLGPNLAILKSLSNWFLVAFAAALLLILFHVFFKGTSANGDA